MRITTAEYTQPVKLPSDVLFTEKSATSSSLKSSNTTTILPTTSFVTSESAHIQQNKTIAMVNKRPHQKMGQRVIQQKHTAKATFPDKGEISTKSPAVTTHVINPSIQHPTPLASQITETPHSSILQITLSPWWENKFWHKQSPEVSEIGKTLTVNTLTILKSSQSSTPAWKRNKDNSEVTVYDRGLYTCMASNPAGADTLTVKLQVIVAPPVILEEKRQHIAGIVGESLKLPCTAKGNPHPSPLHFVNAKLFLFSNGTLYIRNIAPSDSGNYECIATSSTGSERRVVNLTVDEA
uniref:Ig-like domain-containing protein n=1 Tax=Chelonoidis abingdonii TaxID=106734 RepID=A0A8C0GWP3_CHEAB